VERNSKAGQNPPRVVAPIEGGGGGGEEEGVGGGGGEEEKKKKVFDVLRLLKMFPKN
jgi:hypothetical protein